MRKNKFQQLLPQKQKKIHGVWTNNLDIASLDKMEILASYEDSDIFSLVFDFKPKEGDICVSPLRLDKNPSCFFKIDYNQNLCFIDQNSNTYVNGVQKKCFSCFDVIYYYFGFSNYFEVYKYIKDNLESSNNQIVRKNYSAIKEKSIITTVNSDFDNNDFNYWGNYHITLDSLIEDGVSRIISFAIKRGNVITNTICNSIVYDLGTFKEGRKKLYLPYKSGAKRFISTCIPDDIGGIEIEGKKSVIITKSYKDYRVLKNEGLNTIWFQNEVTIPNITILYDKLLKYEYVYIWFDNDLSGVINATKVAAIIQDMFLEKKIINISIPQHFLVRYGIKDPAGLVLKSSKKKLKDFIIYKEISNE